MAREKAPAFQFYPKDWDTDVNVIPMTFEEEGVYWALCRLAWLNGSLPSDLDELRLLLKGRPSLKLMRKWWARVGKCFEVHGAELHHKRLDREREAQAESRNRRSKAANARWDKQRPDAMHMQGPTQTAPDASPLQCSPSASPSTSSTASSTAVTVQRPLVSGSAHPSNWGKVHGPHVAGFCDFVCLPELVFSEFVMRVRSGGASDEDAKAQVKTWALNVRAEWQASGQIPGDNIFDFWRNEWKKTHGSNKPAAGSVDVLAGLR